MSFVRRSEDVTEGSTVGQVLDDETDLVNRMVKNAILEQTIDINFTLKDCFILALQIIESRVSIFEILHCWNFIIFILFGEIKY
jgi:hypothetical protein